MIAVGYHLTRPGRLAGIAQAGLVGREVSGHRNYDWFGSPDGVYVFSGLSSATQWRQRGYCGPCTQLLRCQLRPELVHIDAESVEMFLAGMARTSLDGIEASWTSELDAMFMDAHDYDLVELREVDADVRRRGLHHMIRMLTPQARAELLEIACEGLMWQYSMCVHDAPIAPHLIELQDADGQWHPLAQSEMLAA